MNKYINRISKYKELLEILTIFLFLFLPVSAGKLILFYLLVILLHLYEFVSNPFNNSIYLGILSFIYLILFLYFILKNLTLIKVQPNKIITYFLYFSLYSFGFYSVYSTILTKDYICYMIQFFFFILLIYSSYIQYQINKTN